MPVQEDHVPSCNGGAYQRIAALARSLQEASHGAAGSSMQRIVDHATSEIEGAQYAGVTLTTVAAGVQTPATTHPYPAILDALQQRHRQGPCLEAAWHQHTVRVDDLSTDQRWPHYVRDALRLTPIRSVLSFRLFTSEHTMGALNLYADEPHAFSTTAEEIGYVLATHAALAWQAARRAHQFQSALASRDIIGQAKGILMGRFNITALQAFELLKRLSQERNTKLADIAHQLTHLGDFDGL